MCNELLFFRETLKAGRSKHWKDIIRILTRGHTDRLSADAMLRYFQPLELWLRLQNHNELTIGWKPTQEDTSLFQPLNSRGHTSQTYPTHKRLMNIAIILNLMLIVSRF